MNKPRYNRTKALISKYLRLQVRNLRPTSLRGRWVGPRVLLNSIPKAGTNLLEQTLGHFPLLHRSGFRTLRGWETVDSFTFEKVRHIERGGVATCHLPAHPELMAVIRERDIKTLLMVRDPRDILVSYVKYVTTIDMTHPAHSYFVALPNDESRLLAAIKGVDGVVSPVSETLHKFSGWLDCDGMVVRFEDIIGAEGGGSDEKQLKIVNDIAEYLGIALTSDDAAKISGAIYSDSSITFRQPKLNGWREHFKQHHIDALDEVAGTLMKQYGYFD